MTAACSVRVRGVVQGVGFRPFVFRLARAHTLGGWVRNGHDGVEIHVEGGRRAVRAFLRELRQHPPPASHIVSVDIAPGEPVGLRDFTILESRCADRPSTRISPDLPICNACLAELFDPRDRRHLYPYINCTHCGPRYSILERLPYDRQSTTMAAWPLDEFCARQYGDPADRRFHAQPVACPACGPRYVLKQADLTVGESEAGIRAAAALLAAGGIVAVKGIGGFHLACDARRGAAVHALRERKFRKEQPFALMARDLNHARALVDLSAEAEALMTSAARPIVLAHARIVLDGVAPGTDELGVMLPYAPVHHLLFAAGTPAVLVMTSGNRSSEPIAYDDEDALERLSGIADAFLLGERRIARRVDDSIVRAGVLGSAIVRRSRGMAPEAVATLPAALPILALGADLKNTITLVVGGQAFVSQHIGDLSHAASRRAFVETIDDLCALYGVDRDTLLVAHDMHPEYVSTQQAIELPSIARIAVQHHRAHVASVLAERAAFDRRVLGVALDGTGYGDDGGIWGGEIFAGSVRTGFARVAHLRPAVLPGGDAAAQHPVQAAAGFLAFIDRLPDLTAAPFSFPERYTRALALVHSGIRCFETTSMGRLFDAAAALLGFTRPITFEGQAAISVEQLARRAPRDAEPYPFPFDGRELDYRPLLEAVARDRGRRPDEAIARSFQRGVAAGVSDAIRRLAAAHALTTVVVSGGVFQNELLCRDLAGELAASGLEMWANHRVPANDGGISLGQAAMAALSEGASAPARGD